MVEAQTLEFGDILATFNAGRWNDHWYKSSEEYHIFRIIFAEWKTTWWLNKYNNLNVLWK